jgi:hypothetical protein
MLYCARSQATRRAEIKVYPVACGLVAHLWCTAVEKLRFVTFFVNHTETKQKWKYFSTQWSPGSGRALLFGRLPGFACFVLVRATCRRREYGVLVDDTDTGRPEFLEKSLSVCYIVHHKSHTDWPGNEPWAPQREAGDWPPEPWHCQLRLKFVLLQHKYSVSPSQRKSCVSSAKTKQYLLKNDRIFVYCNNRKEYKQADWAKKTELYLNL